MILEPIMNVEVSAPAPYQGEIISLLTRRSGLLKSTNEVENYFIATSEVSLKIFQFVLNNVFCFKVPLNDMFNFATELRTITQGKGEYTMEYSRYSPTRIELQKELVGKYQQEMATESAQKASKKN